MPSSRTGMTMGGASLQKEIRGLFGHLKLVMLIYAFSLACHLTDSHKMSLIPKPMQFAKFYIFYFPFIFPFLFFISFEV